MDLGGASHKVSCIMHKRHDELLSARAMPTTHSQKIHSEYYFQAASGATIS
jgi:hypothetical protein